MVIKNKNLITEIYFPRSVIREEIKKGAKVLDIGCATGYFLQLCDEKGLQTFGIDISDAFLKSAKKITTAQLKKHDLNKGLKLYKNNTFDLITIFDVIEHLDSPFNFLKECFRITKKGGKVVITTPNIAALGHILTRENWYGYTDKTHQYLFNPDSLAFSSRMAGFKVLRNETPFHPLPRFLDAITSNLSLGGQIWLVLQKTSVTK